MRVTCKPATEIGTILLVQVSALLMREFAERLLQARGLGAHDAANAASLASFAWLALLLTGLLSRMPSIARALPALPPNPMRVCLAAGLIGVLFRFIDWLLLVVREGSPLPRPAAATLVAGCVLDSGFHGSLLTVALLTPLFEEVVYRGMICRRLAACRPGLGIVVSATLFAVLHSGDAVLSAFLFGIAAGRQLQSSRSILGPFLAHATFNALAVTEQWCLRIPAVGAAPETAWLLLGVVATLALALRLATAGAGAVRAPAPGRVSL